MAKCPKWMDILRDKIIEKKMDGRTGQTDGWMEWQNNRWMDGDFF